MGTAALRPTLAYKSTGYCRRISEAVGKNSFGLKVRSGDAGIGASLTMTSGACSLLAIIGTGLSTEARNA